MTNNQQLIANYIQKFVQLLPEEVEVFCNSFKETKIKKRQFIVQPEFTAKYRNYIVDGAFRSYVVGDNGEDHTITFAIKDWWITDYNSYIFQKPATMFVVALEDSLIMQLDFKTEQELKQMNPKFETFFRMIAERSVAFYQRRLITNLTKTAEERYHEFDEKYPAIVQRVPQYALASFLGMTTEYLSKLRNKRVGKKS
ncbi:MAG: Crp/Fnr family transcriptional regulator [Chitinophagaceae bacterium]